MKIIHTADWHLGHRLHERPQNEEQQLFLNWLKETIQQEEIDLLLVSGDIFDTTVPSNQSLKMYYDFLISLKNTTCQQVVITGGNHDSPGTLDAPKALLNALSVSVVGKATGDIKDEVFKISIENEELIVGATPYLRDQDIRKATAGESFDEISDRYKQALIHHYTALAEACNEVNTNNAPMIAMGHLFAIGGSTSESEQTIYIGNLGDIGAEDFPKDFDYIALGHLHRPQKVSGLEQIQYSGSPNILSFSELGYDKQVIQLTISDNSITAISPLVIPTFRSVYSIKGSLDECITKIQRIGAQTHELTPWAEVIIKDLEGTANGFLEIQKAAEPFPIEILKVVLDKSTAPKGLTNTKEQIKNLKELTPEEVFKIKCLEEGVEYNQNNALYDTFYEALQIAREAKIDD